MVEVINFSVDLDMNASHGHVGGNGLGEMCMLTWLTVKMGLNWSMGGARTLSERHEQGLRRFTR